MRARLYVKIGIALLVACSIVGCDSGERRVRRHFAIQIGERVDSTTIRAAVLRVLPLGTSPDRVVAYLERNGIQHDTAPAFGGRGLLSAYYWHRPGRELVAHVSDGPRLIQFVRWSVNIGFEFDPNGYLVGVGVHEGLTGL